MIKFKMYSKKILSVISVLCLCFMNLSRVNAATKIAKLIIFSTTTAQIIPASLGHSWFVIENYKSTSLRIGHCNIGGKRKMTIGTWGNIKQHKGIWYNMEAFINDFPEHVSAGKELTQSDVDKLNTAINSLDKWTIYFNCAFFTTKVWNSVAKTQLTHSNNNAGTPLPQNLARSIKANLTYYKTNRSIEPKGRDYLYYHTSSNKTACKYPTFDNLNVFTRSASSSTQKSYTTSFPPLTTEQYNKIIMEGKE